MKKVVTLGEILLRLAPPAGATLADAAAYSVAFGGSEANVAVALCGFGEEARHITALPANELGTAAVNSLRKFGVDVNCVIRKNGRMGLYYYEQGASLRPGKVVYDRARSVFAETSPEEYDLEAALVGADHLHLSGITPALGENAYALARSALKKAKERGLSTSFDLNFRADLWSREAAQAAFEALLPDVDLCIASSDGLDVLGLPNAGTDLAACERSARALQARYTLRAVALTVRESVSASFNRLSGVYLAEAFSRSPVFEVNIVDRVGGGDAFAAGLIHALLNGAVGGEAVAFAAACNACKHTLCGDNMCVSAAEIANILRGDTRIRR